MPTGILVIQKSTNEPATLSDVQVRHFTHGDMQTHTHCALTVIWTFTCMSEFRCMGLLFPWCLCFNTPNENQPLVSWTLVYTGDLYAITIWAIVYLPLKTKHSNIRSYRVCLDRCVMPKQMVSFMPAKKRCLKNRQGKKRLENPRHWDRFRSPEFKTSQACVEVGQSSTVPDLTFSDPDDCQHLRTG